MRLTNATPVVARLTVGPLPGEEAIRAGMLVAKATYRLDAEGVPTLDGQDPYPLFDADAPTELGLMPRDDLPRSDDAFEVVVLGAAHAPPGERVPVMAVALTLGSRRRELRVFGDRLWQQGPDGWHASEPEPFERMPLGWDRAFGGTAEILLDAASPMLVAHPGNRHGRGFDVERLARRLTEGLHVAEGYPRLDPARPLPNVENPDHLIAAPEDEPEPASWATVPMDTALHAHRSVAWSQVPESPGRALQDGAPFAPGALHRAHPDWVLERRPPAGAAVRLEGFRPEGPLAFELPCLRVLFDYAVGDRRGTRELAPQALVLLPEERAFTLVYRHLFGVPLERGERSARVRIEEGWLGPDDGGRAP